jgi:hypothetical protein
MDELYFLCGACGEVICETKFGAQLRVSSVRESVKRALEPEADE